jgi:hypothetical protein
MLLEAALAGPIPPGVVPLTVNVYAVFTVKPLTVIGDVPVAVIPPGDEVAVYVIAPVPASVGAVNATVAVVEPVAVAVPIVGAAGLLGHVPALTACITDCNAQAPLAALVEVVGGVADITAPL